MPLSQGIAQSAVKTLIALEIFNLQFILIDGYVTEQSILPMNKEPSKIKLSADRSCAAGLRDAVSKIRTMIGQ